MIGTSMLGRYVARRFLLTIVGTFVLCTLLIFMIDFVEILRQSAKTVAGKPSEISLRTMLAIVLLRLPAFTEILLGFAVLVGSIGALLLLSRKSELTVMRASGMSVWQFLRPGLLVACTLGVLAVVAYNPFAAWARGESERIFAEAFGKDANFLRTQSGGSWLRQDGLDGPSVISAAAAANQGLSLAGVLVIQFDKSGAFQERIDAANAQLGEGVWQLTNAWVARPGREPEHYETYLVSTYLTPERVADALGTVQSLSIWDLPGIIEVAEKAGLSAARYRVQYELLLSRPLLLMTMVLLGATVSLRSFRSGKIQTMVITGMIGGFGFFLMSEVSRQIGVAGLVAPWVAVWQPVLLGMLVSLTVLLHQEDG